MKNVLRFINPECHEGVNMTVRRGVKWSVKDVTEGVEIGTPDELLGVFATVTHRRVMRCCDIPTDELLLQHDKPTQNYEGLLFAMKRAYHDFDEAEIVTLVYFTVHQD